MSGGLRQEEKDSQDFKGSKSKQKEGRKRSGEWRMSVILDVQYIKSRNQNVDSKEARNEKITILVGELHAAAEIKCSKFNLIEIVKTLVEDDPYSCIIYDSKWKPCTLDMISRHF